MLSYVEGSIEQADFNEIDDELARENIPADPEVKNYSYTVVDDKVVSAKYSCGFSDFLVSSIIVGERYLDYYITITEDRL